MHKRPNPWAVTVHVGISLWWKWYLPLTNGEQGLEELVKDLGFDLAFTTCIGKEITHVFSHRKWFMKAFRGDLTYAGDAKNITIADIQQQLPKD